MSGVALIATMLNPYGARRLLFPYLQALDPGSTALSIEMWPITDLGTPSGVLVLIAIALLAWGLLTTRGVPPWLILFSFFSVFMSFKSFRFINYLAISILFVYAARTEHAGGGKSALPLSLIMLKNVALCLLCVLLIFFDAFSFLFTCEEMRGESRFATHTRLFAPEICAIKVDGRMPVFPPYAVPASARTSLSRERPVPAVSRHWPESLLQRYQALLLFLLQEPDALDLSLQHLHVNYIILNAETFSWIATIHRLPDWEFVACDSNGMLWKRSPGAPHPLNASDREQVKKSVFQFLQKGDGVFAFAYSTLLDDPPKASASLSNLTPAGGRNPFSIRSAPGSIRCHRPQSRIASPAGIPGNVRWWTPFCRPGSGTRYSQSSSQRIRPAPGPGSGRRWKYGTASSKATGTRPGPFSMRSPRRPFLRSLTTSSGVR